MSKSYFINVFVNIILICSIITDPDTQIFKTSDSDPDQFVSRVSPLRLTHSLLVLLWTFLTFSHSISHSLARQSGCNYFFLQSLGVEPPECLRLTHNMVDRLLKVLGVSIILCPSFYKTQYKNWIQHSGNPLICVLECNKF